MIPRKYHVRAAVTGFVGAALVWLGWWLSQVPPDE